MKLGILPTFLLCSSLALAQEAVDIDAQPHYRLLLQNDQVRVYALTLHRDESAFVRSSLISWRVPTWSAILDCSYVRT